MELFQIKKGLDIPISGRPDTEIIDGPQISYIGLIAEDYTGLKPVFQVAVGDTVAVGQTLFSDRRDPAVSYTSTGAGTVVAINRGDKRKFLSVEIELGDGDTCDFGSIDQDHIHKLSRDDVASKLQQSGQWTSLRSRPFGKVAASDKTPRALFITAMDTRPLAPDPEVIIQSQLRLFNIGLQVLSVLAPEVFVAVKQYSDLNFELPPNATVYVFEGPHPAGLVGTHMHMIQPVYRDIEHWHIDYQDVIAVGHLFIYGQLMTERVIAVGGPSVKSPSLLKTRLGAGIQDLTAGYVNEGTHRFISGSILYGHHTAGVESYLGRYHNQVTVLPESIDRHFMGWAAPGKKQFSLMNVFLSRLIGEKQLEFNTSTNGSHRPIIPIGAYEKVMPMDLMMTHLLRALSIEDVETAEKLGVLELDEEDLALCTYVCPGKNDYIPMLRNVLNLIEKEG